MARPETIEGRVVRMIRRGDGYCVCLTPMDGLVLVKGCRPLAGTTLLGWVAGRKADGLKMLREIRDERVRATVGVRA